MKGIPFTSLFNVITNCIKDLLKIEESGRSLPIMIYQDIVYWPSLLLTCTVTSVYGNPIGTPFVSIGVPKVHEKKFFVNRKTVETL